MSKSDLLFLLVLASLPIQLGKHFFFPHSFVLGLPIDYRSLTIYFSDFAVFLYLAVFFYENRKKTKIIFRKFKPFVIAAFVFNFYLLSSTIFFSVSKEASLIFLAKTAVFTLFAVASAETLSKKAILKPGLFMWVSIIKFALIVESAILISQFAIQRSLNLGLLGERSFDITTPQIAHFDFFGNQLLRSYGTFPHPNVAAAFLVFGLILILGSEKFKKPSSRFGLLFTALGLILTFSKSALVSLVVSSAIIFAKKKGILLITLVLISSILLLLKNTSDSSLPTISERLVLIQKSLDMTLTNPLFGVGSNNFILELSKANLFSVNQVRLLQPVHNIFFLILAENGAVGLLLFTALLFVVLKSANTKPKIALFVAILIFASVDHFLWTLQQGQLLFWLSLGYILSNADI